MLRKIANWKSSTLETRTPLKSAKTRPFMPLDRILVAGLCGPCHVVRRHVIRDVHKYCDAYVLHSQGSLHSNNTVVTVPRFAVKSFPSTIQAYFERQKFSELRALLTCLYPSDPVKPKTIFPKYIAVFCTLLFAGRGKYIKHFTRFDNLSDTALPFDPKNPPTNQPFTAGDPDFWTDFCKEQWRFCTPILEDSISDKHFETERVLPIIYKERLAGGGSANLWLVKIYPFQDHP